MTCRIVATKVFGVGILLTLDYLSHEFRWLIEGPRR
jgi:hypothetical protein